MEDTGKLALHIVVAAIAGLGRNSKQRVFQNTVAIGFLCFVEALHEIGELVHLHVRVCPKLLILFLLVELVPPLMATAAGAGALVHRGVIKSVTHTAVIFVLASEADAFAGG